MKEQSGHSNCSELERIMKIMEPYIQSCPLYDIVRSDKFGYLLISMPAGDQIDDAELIPLDCAETLLRELYTNLAYDFMQQEGHCVDYTRATALELRAMKEWIKPYTDQLPEYQYILEDILPKKELTMQQSRTDDFHRLPECALTIKDGVSIPPDSGSPLI